MRRHPAARRKDTLRGVHPADILRAAIEGIESGETILLLYDPVRASNVNSDGCFPECFERQSRRRG